ncbi:MAG: hypothetical protein M3Z04_05465 [Chloroflexota bacterium]|nr:hypothetical protein [Chloroflexota bacterium]
MRTQNNPVPMGLWRGLALLGVLLAATACGSSVANTGVSSPQQGTLNVPVNMSVAAPTIAVPTQPGRFMFGSRDLRGASDAEFAQYAQDWARHQLQAKNTPSILLARAVTYEEMPTLGLGCPPNFATIELPPVMVAILRGEFDFRGAGPGFRHASAPVAGKERYVYYLFDVWSATPVVTMASDDGAVFRQALHDPTLPNRPEAQLPGACSPQIQRDLHYGQPVPGMPPPTAVPPGSVPTAAPSMPPPVGTWEPPALTPGVKP